MKTLVKYFRKLWDMIKSIASLFDGKGRSYRKYAVRQHDLTDCGAACILSLAKFYRFDLPISKIRIWASTDQKGTSVLGMIEAFDKLGFQAKGIRIKADQLPHVPVPIVAHVIKKEVLQHYVVIFEVKDNAVCVMDPADGKIEWMDFEQFGRIATGIMVMVQPGENFEPYQQKYSVSRRFLYLLRPHRPILYQILLGAVLATVMGLSTSIFLQKIIDHVLPEGNGNLLNLMGMVMLVILIFSVTINVVKSTLTLQTGQRIDAQLILGYYKHLLKLPQQFFDTMRTGEIISRINDAVKIRTFINDVLIGAVVNVFVLIFSFSLMFAFYWKLAMLMLLILPFYGGIYFFSNRVNRKTQRNLMENTAELEAQLVESINSIGTIKRFGMETFTNQRTESRFVNLLGSVYQSGTNSIWIGNSSSFITSLFTVILLWAGTTFVLDRQLTPGELLTFYAIMGYFTGPVISFIGMNKTIQDAIIAADRLFEIMDIEREQGGDKVELTREKVGNITFEKVNFRYGARANVFENLTMEIPAGKLVGMVGESGSGKSTVLSLLQGLYPIQSGKIAIGDLDLKYINLNSLRSMIAVVPQEIHLFAGSILENIAIGQYKIEIEKVVRICKELGILDFIESLPQGFHTYIGENGVSLSGGQRQRIAIARAIYKDPEILILDEATSSLDSKSEAYVQQMIRRLRKEGKTIILIAHRLSTIVDCDLIYVFDKGKLTEVGEFQNLLTEKGAFHSLWEKQMKGFIA